MVSSLSNILLFLCIFGVGSLSGGTCGVIFMDFLLCLAPSMLKERESQPFGWLSSDFDDGSGRGLVLGIVSFIVGALVGIPVVAWQAHHALAAIGTTALAGLPVIAVMEIFLFGVSLTVARYIGVWLTKFMSAIAKASISAGVWLAGPEKQEQLLPTATTKQLSDWQVEMYLSEPDDLEQKFQYLNRD